MSNPVQGRRVEWSGQILGRGEYAKLPDGTWYAGTPSGETANLVGHRVTEHEDGTITVDPSIKVFWPKTATAPEVVFYHGHLKRGLWETIYE